MSNTDKKIIGIFLHALHYGGIEKFVETHREVYNPQVNDCHVVVNREGDKAQVEHFESLGFKVHLVPMKSPKHVTAEAKAGYRNLFEELRFDVVHCNQATNMLPLQYAKKYGVGRIVLHSHNDYLTSIGDKKAAVRFAYRKIMEANAAKADVLLACSEDAAKVFGRYSGKAQIINNAIDFDAFAFNSEVRSRVRADLSVAENCSVFVHVGRMETSQKNQEFLLEVFAAYRQSNPNSLLVLVGAGRKLQQLKALADELGVADAVRFVGTTNRVQDYYSAADMFLFPSLYEGLGIALVEAQASGLPCVASDRVPARAKYTDNVTFVSVDDGAEPWVCAIGDGLEKGRVPFGNGTIASSGYSLEGTKGLLKLALGLEDAEPALPEAKGHR